ncbi:peptide chain release factor N(5)-glutamine methyltransferase [Candidatus Dependentiae bacterium]|nr:peptide chain release factor N(5)-glutamine methyltransferase [Candidatus Dependentiae bacterium]
MNKALSEIIHEVAEQLQAYDTDPTVRQRTAMHLISFITGLTHSQLYTTTMVAFSSEQQQWLQQAVIELTVQHKPLAYILGWIPFLDLHIIVQPPLLIPRPETEAWVHTLIDQLPIDLPLRIIDVGTGTGCIALAIAQKRPRATVIGIDINPMAVACAQLNAHKNAIKNATFVVADIATYKPAQPCSLIVGNPPYIPLDQLATLQPSVRYWEDHRALIAGADGLAVIKQMLQAGKQFVRPVHSLPAVVIEIDASHGAIIQQLADEYGYTKTIVLSDSNDRPRVLYAWLAQSDLS